jgi:hypothetical protein
VDINPNNPASSSSYMSGRKRYGRPQAMLWADNAGNYSNNIRFPLGMEKEDFIILSDHNRQPINITQQRIESRQRMINGTMRSYHIADKIIISCGWQMLPSRSYSTNINFNSSGKAVMSNADYENTADGGAGGVEILDWYENHSGPFYVYLAYDKYNNFTTGDQIDENSFNHLSIYNDVRHMYFSSFDYSIQKRGSTNFDYWTINFSLEEV